MLRYLLDTNICIAAMRNNSAVVGRMSSISPAECAVSSITTYELFTGVEKCAAPEQERAKVRLLLNAITEIPFDSQAALEAAHIRGDLERQGTPIGPYDFLLAGQARSHQLMLVTANDREFTRVSGLGVENWLAPRN